MYYNLPTNNKHEERLSIAVENEQRFFRNVEILRKRKGISQERLCELASDDSFKVNYRSISVYGGWSKKKYKRRCSLYYLAAFADALGVSVGEMLSNKFEENG
jgi:hypothetical protein